MYCAKPMELSSGVGHVKNIFNQSLDFVLYSIWYNQAECKIEYKFYVKVLMTKTRMQHVYMALKRHCDKWCLGKVDLPFLIQALIIHFRQSFQINKTNENRQRWDNNIIQTFNQCMCFYSMTPGGDTVLISCCQEVKGCKSDSATCIMLWC